MTDKGIVISLDVMGGDNSPHAEIEGLELFLKTCQHENVRFILHGKGITGLLAKHPRVLAVSTVVEAEDVVMPSDKPSLALRKRKNSSMYKAITSVKSGESQAIISSGNTGALMAISLLELRTLENIYRPAIIAVLPSIDSNYVMLDLGANVNCDADSLVQFAIMGRAFARIVLKKQNPSIALLNIGEEQAKGTDSIREAYNVLNQVGSKMRFVGYMESDKAFDGKVDVVVTDGFCGNVFLKAAEGTCRIMKKILKLSLQKSWITRVLSPIIGCSLKASLKKFEPQNNNGGMLVGLNGIVIKSHGSAGKEAFCSAINVTMEAIKNDINRQIIDEIKKFGTS